MTLSAERKAKNCQGDDSLYLYAMRHALGAMRSDPRNAGSSTGFKDQINFYGTYDLGRIAESTILAEPH